MFERFRCEYCRTISRGDRCPSCNAPRTAPAMADHDQEAIDTAAQRNMELLPLMVVYEVFGIGRAIRWAFRWRK